MKRPILAALATISSVAIGIGAMEYFLGVPIRPVLAYQFNVRTAMEDDRYLAQMRREIQAIDRRIDELNVDIEEYQFKQLRVPNYIILKIQNLRVIRDELTEDRNAAKGEGG